ncbi:ABC transporter permease [Halanaerobium praevalens]|uniref:Carbohydrate ABC transporter membrane protein 1, CUT1 family n=1 Tax=Halanaerobium praevalens (strain ATCC 33744 / DSM 2228 / GSL) TaxID=572479 RepID=E3DS39_HALPG|nr:ABC transporter permease subunit [Halanaerobium praevalens]ADO78187.1 carbohydrate ABC transporter membrane protein 1, CUT1 family [Halanaerobium praevalens DSM 2228]
MRKKWTRDDTELTLLAIPTFIWYILFSFLPMFGVLIAFKKYQVFPGESFLYNIVNSNWVGFDNFKYILQSNSFLILLRNTLAYNITFIILGIFISVTLAIIISLIYGKWRSKIYQTFMFFPHFLSWVVVSYFFYAFFSYDKGVLNSILNYFHLNSIQWYMESKYWPYILIIVQLWKTTGYNTVIYLASIMGIDPSLYEAAVIDGASTWQQVKHITIPSIRPIVIMMFILNTGRIFFSDFGLFYQVTRGIPAPIYDTVSTIDTYVYQSLLSSTPIGMTTAVTLLQSVACCITILLANWIVKKIDKDYAII